MLVFLTQLALAIVLFFAVNWIGEHSRSFGYLQLMLVPKPDPAPAYNFLLKTLTPSVYIVLASTGIYALHLPRLLVNIWLVAFYYFVFRLAFNVVLNRAALMNWVTTLTQVILGTGAAYLVYYHLVLPRRPLFPDLVSIGNQLWVIIALFLYAVFNNVQVASARTVRRKNRYLTTRLSELRKLYGSLIDGQFPERYMELVAYSVLIYETFNRPPSARFIERLVFPWGSHTLGPMQVKTSTRISDIESVSLGVAQLRGAFERTNQELAGKGPSRYKVIHNAVAKYNRDESYVSDVLSVLHTLWAQVATDYRSDFENMYYPTLS
jgi:hypothetical protein